MIREVARSNAKEKQDLPLPLQLSANLRVPARINQRPCADHPDWLHWRALATPAKLAVLFEGRSVTYAELDRLAHAQAAGLAAQGVQPGDKVAARVENSLEAVALIHAVARLHAVFVPLNTRLTASETAW